MQNILINIFIFILSIIIMLFIIEGIIRIKNSDMKNYNIEMWRYTKELKVKSDDSKLAFYHKPSSEAILQSVKIRTNNYGLRGKDIKEKTDVNRRILFLGSSATLGWGVKEEDTMAYLLNKKLGDNTEVLNAGVGNYNSVRYVQLFFTKLKELKPTDIVIHFFLNDAEDLHTKNSNWFLKNSQLSVLVWNAINTFTNKNNTLLDYYKKIYNKDYIGYKNMIESIDKLAEYAKKENIRLYFTLLPDLHFLHENSINPYYSEVEEIAKSKGFKFLNLIDSFDKNINAEEFWVMPTDHHPNKLAHKLMAERIYPFLQLENN
ncbi:SGNH/GDSL hydrolase family protein [Malaciobacter mytili]|uniref:SGNH/GDSL hydrolase family protein n=1 Tax=Malaciobacter mytili TaxID=603050 RepID=UPI003BB1A2A4